MVTDSSKITSPTTKKPRSQAIYARKINKTNVAIQQAQLQQFPFDPFKVSQIVVNIDDTKLFKKRFRAFMCVVIRYTLQAEPFNYRTRETIAEDMAKELGSPVYVNLVTKCTQLAKVLGLEVTQWTLLESNISMLNGAFYKLPFARRVLQLLKSFQNLPERVKALISSVGVKIVTLSKNSKKEKTRNGTKSHEEMIQKPSFSADEPMGVPHIGEETLIKVHNVIPWQLNLKMSNYVDTMIEFSMLEVERIVVNGKTNDKWKNNFSS